MTAKDFNKKVTHPLQSHEWGEFRKKTGVKVVSGKDYQLTIHRLPYLNFNIGYLPKGNIPDKKLIEDLQKIGKENNCIFIQLEPNVISGKRSDYPLASELNADTNQNSNTKSFNLSRRSLSEDGKSRSSKQKSDERHLATWVDAEQLSLRPAAHPLFTRYTFILDLTKSEDELLKAMHPKTRYNIKVAEKHGVKVVEDNSDKAFKEYLKLTEETTKRQKFFAHTRRYHKLMWQTLRQAQGKLKMENARPAKLGRSGGKWKMENGNRLIAHLLLAKYKNKTLVAWVVFTFKDTLYYPYGASSDKYRETMASNLIMWEAIRFGKKLGLAKFDMWGALGPNPDPKDPWYGFHKFKQGYGGELIEFVGSYDLVINPVLYQLYKLADKTRWFILKLK